MARLPKAEMEALMKKLNAYKQRQTEGIDMQPDDPSKPDAAWYLGKRSVREPLDYDYRTQGFDGYYDIE